jgi:hypothetical protein
MRLIRIAVPVQALYDNNGSRVRAGKQAHTVSWFMHFAVAVFRILNSGPVARTHMVTYLPRTEMSRSYTLFVNGWYIEGRHTGNAIVCLF